MTPNFRVHLVPKEWCTSLVSTCHLLEPSGELIPGQLILAERLGESSGWFCVGNEGVRYPQKTKVLIHIYIYIHISTTHTYVYIYIYI